jgi:hypothetical protein
MMNKAKWLTLSAIASTGLLLQSGCLGAFWDGLINSGWPTDNRWLNIGLDVANEIVFG